MLSSNLCCKLNPAVKLAVTNAYRHTSQQVKPFRLLTRGFRFSAPNTASIRNRLTKSRRSGSDNSSSIALDRGRIAVAAGAALGIGGLCYYGLSLNTQGVSAFDQAAIWPDYVRQRIRATYGFFAGSAAIAGVTALNLARSPGFCNVLSRFGIAAPIGMLVVSVGTSIFCQSIPYPDSGIGMKHFAWALFSASIGAMLVPACFVGGPILTRAAVYTGGIVGGLSLVAASAPSDQFLKWGGPLAMGLGVVFVASLGSMFMSPLGRLGSGFYAVSLYGGLVLFSGFILYDTQLVLDRAVNHPKIDRYYGQGQVIRPFDPINNSIRIFMDTVNIFIRMVAILGNGQRRK